MPLPGDVAIAHRALLLSALSSGRSRVRRFSHATDAVATMRALQALGVLVEDDGQGTVAIEGRGISPLSGPSGPIDCASAGG